MTKTNLTLIGATLLVYLTVGCQSFQISPFAHKRVTNVAHSEPLYMSQTPDATELTKQKETAWTCLQEFHAGKWKGKARIFSVAGDEIHPPESLVPYESVVQTYMEGGGDLVLSEIFSDGKQETDPRTIPLCASSVDVDSEDSSYSFDIMKSNLPPAFIIGGGSDINEIKFGIEHCLIPSEDSRVRVFLFYDVYDRLVRIVIGDEERETTRLPSDSVLEKQFIGDSDAITDMVKGMQKTREKRKDTGSEEYIIERLEMNLIILPSGLWLGDVVIRDQSSFTTPPPKINKGFGNVGLVNTGNQWSGFADWNLGVQRIAMTYKSEFGETGVTQRFDAGRSIGVQLPPNLQNVFDGTVVMSKIDRKKSREERSLIVMDFGKGEYTGILSGSVWVKAPRVLSFSSENLFSTEIAMFQKRTKKQTPEEIKAFLSESIDDILDKDNFAIPDMFCSRMNRCYGEKGNLLHGSTSLFELKFVEDELEDIAKYG